MPTARSQSTQSPVGADARWGGWFGFQVRTHIRDHFMKTKMCQTNLNMPEQAVTF